MGDCGDCGGPVSAHFLVVRCTAVAALLALLQSENLVHAAGGAAAAPAVDLTELRRNIVRGLKLDRLPDMSKVDIGNDEFHCKYLEYFRRLYADGSTTDGPLQPRRDDAVSAIRVRGRVTTTPPHDTASSADDRRPEEDRATVTFPVHRAMAARRGGATVVQSVARVYVHRATDAGGRDRRIDVYARLTGGVGPPERPSLVADLPWPDGGRWRDVDVTRLFRGPRRRGAAELVLELRYPAGALRLGGGDADDGRAPVLHAFLYGGYDDDDDGGGGTKRKKRDAGARKRRGPSAVGGGRVGRTDCKAPGGGNGTEPSSRNKCCRERMLVNFADIPGFDFIAMPKSFDAGLCRGRCPAKYNPATRHAFIQSLMSKRHRGGGGGGDDDDDRGVGSGNGPELGNAGQRSGPRRGRRRVRHRGEEPLLLPRSSAPRPPPKPCCAPSKLDSLQIVHVDEANSSRLVVTTWEEMSVVECACS